MSKTWGVGAWALDAEREEAEEREQVAASIPIAGEAPQSFPSLKEAAATKPKKKKGVSMSLSQFTTGAFPVSGGGRSSEPRGLTPAEMVRLPTGPRERSAEELENRGLGGGFRSYGYGGGGGGSGGGAGRRSDEGDASWGGGGRRSYGGGFEEEERRGSAAARVSDVDQPSRADEVDNWATTKKSFAPSPMESGRQDRDRYSSLGSGSSSRADDMDNWSHGKKPLTSSRSPSFGTGFRDSPVAPDSDRWVKGGGGGAPPPNNGDRERRRLVLDPPKVIASGPTETTATHPSPFGAARPREEVLAEKGLDWRKFDSETEFKKTSRPTSSHSSRPSSAQSSRPGSPGSQAAGAEGAPQARPKVNPFGDAKPREVLLQERGKDWRKIDSELEHRRVDRSETEAEKLLKEEINRLKKAVTDETETNLNDSSAQISAEELAGVREQILLRENQLEMLIRELDDKVRFSQKDTRPGSGTDRATSQHGVSDDSRSSEFMERPRSRGGMGDAWAKPMDDRRGSHWGRESSFFGSRNMERPNSRERW